jgi:DNA-binding IclR family transcriptional regulator
LTKNTVPQLSTPQVNSVMHAIRILELFAIKQKQYLTLGEISLSLQIHKTTVYRILRTLQKVGWIKQNENGGHYCLGSGALLVTANAISHYTRQALFEEEMRNLANQFNELVILAELHGDLGVCVDLIKSKHNLSLQTVTCYVVPLNAGATGKTLLSAQPDDIMERILRLMPKKNMPKLREEIKAIRAQGFCYSEGEVDLGVTAVAVPIRLKHGIFVLSISGPTERLKKMGYDIIRFALLNSATNIIRKDTVINDNTF